MNVKELLSDIERENEFIKTLFNFTTLQEKNYSDRITKIVSFLQNSKNGPNYFIQLIDYYSLCRPQHSDLSKLFIKCIFFCFLETTEQNITFLKKQTDVLNSIMFPEELQQKITTSQKNEEFEKKKNELFHLFRKIMIIFSIHF